LRFFFRDVLERRRREEMFSVEFLRRGEGREGGGWSLAWLGKGVA
jgi:hypothetical protein